LGGGIESLASGLLVTTSFSIAMTLSNTLYQSSIQTPYPLCEPQNFFLVLTMFTQKHVLYKQRDTSQDQKKTESTQNHGWHHFLTGYHCNLKSGEYTSVGTRYKVKSSRVGAVEQQLPHGPTPLRPCSQNRY